MQSAIHEGYEYQDYFTVSIILQLMLRQTDAEIIIDRKDFSGDKFDDLKVKTPNGTRLMVPLNFRLSILMMKAPTNLLKMTLQMVMDMILRYAIFSLLGKQEKNLKMILR